ncbi:MAG: nucleoside recognition protein [Desulfobacterales bacterium C00003060]|nr:MAG: nucleoside recognition protein [Desulfobacterales bacterium S3730MH5]OEU80333.1 MAG: nucleoside recognition protein [Desulfobacterales bacterium C00003060]OEU84011.1 MAG: nucleoside recognition protein [Desulfobacterales bacterium S5133MH4]
MKGLLWPLMRLMVLIAIGLLVGNIIEGLGWVTRIASLSRPMMRFGHMCDYSGAAFTTAFFSGVAANTMLLSYYKEKKITKKELFLSNFINGLPAYFLHLPTTFFIILPLTGVAGALYLFLTFLATLFRTLCYLLYGRFFLSPTQCTATLTLPSKKSWTDVWNNIRQELPGRFLKIAVYVIPIFVCVFIVNQLGFFQWLRQSTASLITSQIMPVEAVSVVIFSLAAEFTSGFAAAGALLQAGALTVKQTVLALLIGNIISFPVRALRHQLPRYVGIFSPKLGTQMLLIGQGFRILSIFLVALLYLFLG